jgi:hypothetical protein
MKVKEAERSGIETDIFHAVLQCCEKAVEVHFVAGNHVTILDSKVTTSVINREVSNIDAVNSRHNHTEECLF